MHRMAGQHGTTTFNERVTGRTVVISGAGGSIGSELVRQVLLLKPRKVFLIDHSEIALYDVMQSIKGIDHSAVIVPALVDIRDVDALDAVLEGQIDTFLHAAAYKHVPMLETPENAMEGLRVNVLGTLHLLHEASKHKAYFLLVSTDKAAAPASFMGLTKRLAELTLLAYSGTLGVRSDYVRFGNVFGSSGSVVPLFLKQIREGGPVTVTDPEMTRFFMSISQAVSLVLSVAGSTHEQESNTTLYVLDMGAPRKIVDLARDLITQQGLQPGIDIEIVYTGIRPGEKLHEILEYGNEHLVPSSISGVSFYCSPPIDYEPINRLCDAIVSRDHRSVRDMIDVLVPEYTGADPWWPKNG